MPRSLALALLTAVLLALVPMVASGHPERPTVFPEVNGVPPQAEIPTYRSRGPSHVVCKRDSRSLLKRMYRRDARVLRSRLRTLDRCKFRHIQSAVNAARSGDRILIMPGVYREEPSRRVPVGTFGQEPCPGDYAETEGFANSAPPPAGPRSNDPPVRPNRNFHRKCPNSHNLIAIIGDPTEEADAQHPSVPQCRQLCNLQVEGLGRRAKDVRIIGDRKKADVIRVDRADGIFLRNFEIEQASFNNIDLVELSGFRVSKIISRYAQNYGVLSFTSVNGLYDHITAYGNGDSGLYPGSSEKGCDIPPNVYGTCDQLTPGDRQGGCQRWTTEIRESRSFGNTLGYSGTAGNSTWVHDNKFHDNATGLTTDSFAQGHPGMPQECVKWENNEIYSNNFNPFTQERQDYCRRTPFEQREVEIVCPQFQTAVGTGILIGGGNRNLIRSNRIWDNWRWGALLIGVPAAVRNENDPDRQDDTSHGNRFLDNVMGTAEDGSARPNGLDFKWDSQGARNCWERNSSKSGAARQSDPGSLPTCPGSSAVQPANGAVVAPLAACTAWDPYENTDPVGCDWFTTPPKPE